MTPSYVTVLRSNSPYFPIKDEEIPYELFEERAINAANNTPSKVITPEDFTVCSVEFSDGTKMTVGQMALMEGCDYGILDYLSTYWSMQEELEANSDDPKSEDAMDQIDNIFMKIDWGRH